MARLKDKALDLNTTKLSNHCVSGGGGRVRDGRGRSGNPQGRSSFFFGSRGIAFDQ